MFAIVPLFPDQASTGAEEVDHLFFFELGVTGFFAILVVVLVLTFCVRYRRRTEQDRTPRILGSLRLEIFWSVVPLILAIVMCVWGARVYVNLTRPPENAEVVYVVGKQWMWKLQHERGQSEINELHLEVNRPVRLILTSEDVIHDFFVPAFRSHIDVLPGRYVETWYKPTQVGDFHLFCSQYCGTYHAGMVGTVHVMRSEDYAAWLNSHTAQGSMVTQGRQLFFKLECISCHRVDSQQHAPSLEGLYRSRVQLNDGRTVIADDNYIRRSILRPRDDVVQGWEAIMPSFDGQLADPAIELTQEEALMQLLAYIKSLQRGQTPVPNSEFPPPVGARTTPPEPKGNK